MSGVPKRSSINRWKEPAMSVERHTKETHSIPRHNGHKVDFVAVSARLLEGILGQTKRGIKEVGLHPSESVRSAVVREYESRRTGLLESTSVINTDTNSRHMESSSVPKKQKKTRVGEHAITCRGIGRVVEPHSIWSSVDALGIRHGCRMFLGVITGLAEYVKNAGVSLRQTTSQIDFLKSWTRRVSKPMSRLSIVSGYGIFPMVALFARNVIVVSRYASGQSIEDFFTSLAE